MVQRYMQSRDFPGELAEAYNERVRLQRRFDRMRVSGEAGQTEAYEAMQEADSRYNQLLQASREAEAESNHRTGRVVLWLLGMASVALVVVCCAGWLSPF